MAQKRKKTSGSDDEPLFLKRPRHATNDDGEAPSSEPGIDPTYGQRSAFPGLDDFKGEDPLFYGPAGDGVEYLRMVRSETKGLPAFLAAPVATELEEKNLQIDSFHGYYSDGTYTAAPMPSVQNTILEDQEGEEEDLDPQECYYESLLARFVNLSKLLSSSPPSPVLARLSYTNGPELAPANWSEWRQHILYTPPTSATLSKIGQKGVISALRVLEASLSWKTLQKNEYIGAWAWSLLAKCQEVGMMPSEEVAVLRDLGKRARNLVQELHARLKSQKHDNKMNDGDVELDYDETPSLEQDSLYAAESSPEPGLLHKEGEQNLAHGNGLTGQKADEETLDHLANAINHLKQPEARLIAINNQPNDTNTIHNDDIVQQPSSPGTPTSSPSSRLEENKDTFAESVAESTVPLTINISCTLDMIITIVGEFYGQRDLLDGREVWGEQA
ncbi:MAG: hypothetical protein Q9214_002721 [Letrouitia sp. 1 TL-2023]